MEQHFTPKGGDFTQKGRYIWAGGCSIIIRFFFQTTQQRIPALPELTWIFKNFFIGVVLIYNVVLVSGVQQSESVIHTSTLFQILFLYMYYRVLSRVPCAIQQVLISYLFYIQQCAYVNPNLPIYPSPVLTPW